MWRRGVLAITLAALASGAALAATASPPRLATTLVVGRAPCGETVAFGSVWVAVDGAGTLVRIDPGRARVTRSIRVGATACAVAAGPGALWVARYRPSELVRVDRRTGTVRRLRLGRVPFDVLVASSIWATWFDDGTVTRLDPRTSRLVQRIRVGGSPAGLALCGRQLWVGGGRHDTWLTVVDAFSGRSVRANVGVESPAWPECIGGSVWSPYVDGVVRIDALTHAVTATVVTGGTPARIAAGPDGLVWVTDKERNRVMRIDPTTNGVVDEVAAGPGAFDLVRAGGAMWVTSYAGSDVRSFVAR